MVELDRFSLNVYVPSPTENYRINFNSTTAALVLTRRYRTLTGVVFISKLRVIQLQALLQKTLNPQHHEVARGKKGSSTTVLV
jgi:hypothetical protein